MKKNTIKFLVLQLSLFFVMLLMFMFIFSYVNKSIILNRNLAFIKENSMEKIDTLNVFFNSSKDSLDMSSYILSKEGSSFNPQQLKRLSENSPFDYMRFIDKNGINYNQDGITTDVKIRKYYKEGIKGKKGVEVVYNSRVNGESLVILYTPFIHDNQINGVITGCFKTETVSGYLESMFEDISGFSLICDKTGNVIASSQANFTNKRIESIADYVCDSKYRDIMMKNFYDLNSEPFVIKKGKDKNICLVYPIENYDWVYVRVIYSLTNIGSLRTYYIIEELMIVLLILIFSISLFVMNKFNQTQEKQFVSKSKDYGFVVNGLCNLFSLIYLVDVRTQSYKYIGNEKNPDVPLSLRGTYDELKNYICSLLSEENDVENLKDNLQLDYLVSTMNENVSFYRYELELADEDVKWVHLMIICVRRRDTKIDKLLFTIQDISAQKQEEIEYHDFLKETVANAERASRSRNIFLSNMSHDMRTPLNGIIGSAEIAATHLDDPASLKKNIDMISSTSKQLLQQINGILDLASIETGDVAVREDYTNFPQFIDELIGKFIENIEEKNISLYTTITNLTHENFIVDSNILLNALSNIMDDCVKYTQCGGSIFVKINEHEMGIASKSEIEIIIEDTGIGMESEVLTHIFDPFYRKDVARGGKVAGTGIGLTIALNLIEMLDGSLIVESEVGQGTKFNVRVPIKTKEAIQFTRFTNRSVLLAEKDQIAVEFSSNIFTNMDMDLTICNSTDDVVDNLSKKRKTPVEFIILDMKFPCSNIKDFIAELRAKNKTCPQIILTGYNDLSEEDVKKLGGDNYIRKPFFYSRIIKVLNNSSVLKKSVSQTEVEENEDYNLQDLNFNGKKVLLVEDNKLNAEIACGILEMMQLKVDYAEDGQIAIDTLLSKRANYYSLVLMDLKMPIMDGITATKIIRASDREDLHKLPIVALTANTAIFDKQQTFDAGMNDHIEKPLDIKKMVKVLKTFCSE